MPNCPECNFPYEEGQAFCNTCGCKLPVTIKQKVCPVCGNTLLENTKVCNICGTPVSVPQDTTAAEELAKQQEALKNPTMDAVEIPVITDDMLQNEEPNKADMPTMDSIFMPGQEPAPKSVQTAKPAPAPAPIPTPAPAPIPQTQYQQPVQPQNQFQQTNQYQQPVQPQNQFQQTNQYQQPMQPQNQFPQNNVPINNAPINNVPQNGVKPGKKSFAPLILFILIIAVILVDVFVLFRKQIFKDKDNSAKKNAAVITVTDDIF